MSKSVICLVRVFVDECVDWRLARNIVGHEVKTAHQMGCDHWFPMSATLACLRRKRRINIGEER